MRSIPVRVFRHRILPRGIDELPGEAVHQRALATRTGRCGQRAVYPRRSTPTKPTCLSCNPLLDCRHAWHWRVIESARGCTESNDTRAGLRDDKVSRCDPAGMPFQVAERDYTPEALRQGKDHAIAEQSLDRVFPDAVAVPDQVEPCISECLAILISRA